MTLVAGIDSSTQSCKIVIRDLESGAVVRTGRASHPDGTEVNPDLWWDALLLAIADAGGLSDVVALSIAGQQHGMVCLDEHGAIVRPALLWTSCTNWATKRGRRPAATCLLPHLP
jgi:xylulokinase